MGKALFPDLTADVTGGIARFKPIRLDLLARDAMCAAQARAANASSLDPLAEKAAVDSDVRQITFLISQAENAIATAVSDGDMTEDDATYFRDLQAKSISRLAVGELSAAADSLSAACNVFE